MIDYLREIADEAAICSVEVRKIVKLLQQAIDDRKRIFLIGNGGSWATAIHIAEDLSRYGANASALDSLPLVSAIANDVGYQNIFIYQLVTFATRDDVLIALSVSGKSKNVVGAVLHAQSRGIHVITLTGKDNPVLRANSDVSISLSRHYQAIDNASCMLVEPIHFALLHWVVYQVRPCRR
jgi:D-sedoheptulose 7-phosphate isomerase